MLYLGNVGAVVFERNEHGHFVFTVTGLNHTGKQEIRRLATAGFRISKEAKFCLTSKDGYNKNHRLVAGQKYKIALMPTKEIRRDSDRTINALRMRGIKKYGYRKPLAGIIPRVREIVSDKQMEEMGFWYIAALHDPIKDSVGVPRVLCAHRLFEGFWLCTGLGSPSERCWYGPCAVAFLVP